MGMAWNIAQQRQEISEKKEQKSGEPEVKRQ